MSNSASQNDVPNLLFNHSDEGDEAGFCTVNIERIKHSQRLSDSDFVAQEVPIAMVFNGISHAVMLATPCDLIDFAYGFSFAEGIIEKPADIYEVEPIYHPSVGIELHINIASGNFMRLKEHRRSLVGRTGCGLCGLESLTAFNASNAQHSSADSTSLQDFAIKEDALFDAFGALANEQIINQKTGSLHAAAWIDNAGRVLLVKEDVGRHNALDKLIGALLQAQTDFKKGGVIMSSRASYELVQKSVKAGIPLLATISAPTRLAIDHASRDGLTLIGFVRHKNLAIYSHPERLL